METNLRFFLRPYSTAIVVKTFKNSVFVPIPRRGEDVFFEPDDFLKASDSPLGIDWDKVDIDYDGYTVDEVQYSYGEDFTLVDVFVDGLYFDDVDCEDLPI